MNFSGTHRVRHEFTSATEADSAMVERWNAVVKPLDHVYHLGDVAFGSRDLMNAIMRQLHGKKRLILGNHDRYDMRSYREAGFQKITSSVRFDKVLFTHIPVHPLTLGSPKVIANAHGHIHERTYDGPYINLCVEQTNYTPVPLEEVIQRSKQLTSIGSVL